MTASIATFDDCYELAGGRAWMRRHLTAMKAGGEAFAMRDEGELLAIAFLAPTPIGREFCVGFTSRARPRTRELVRYAQLILPRMAEDGPINCYVAPGNATGARMATLIGFVKDPDHSFRWRLRANDGG